MEPSAEQERIMREAECPSAESPLEKNCSAATDAVTDAVRDAVTDADWELFRASLLWGEKVPETWFKDLSEKQLRAWIEQRGIELRASEEVLEDARLHERPDFRAKVKLAAARDETYLYFALHIEPKAQVAGHLIRIILDPLRTQELIWQGDVCLPVEMASRASCAPLQVKAHEELHIRPISEGGLAMPHYESRDYAAYRYASDILLLRLAQEDLCALIGQGRTQIEEGDCFAYNVCVNALPEDPKKRGRITKTAERQKVFAAPPALIEKSLRGDRFDCSLYGGLLLFQKAQLEPLRDERYLYQQLSFLYAAAYTELTMTGDFPESIEVLWQTKNKLLLQSEKSVLKPEKTSESEVVYSKHTATEGWAPWLLADQPPPNLTYERTRHSFELLYEAKDLGLRLAVTSDFILIREDF